MSVLEERKLAEQEFHDRIRTVDGDSGVAATRWSPELEDTIKNNPLWANMKFYAIERKNRSLCLEWFKENCPGKRVLDYCCGNGGDSLFIAQHGACEVVGIDLSEVSIGNCRESARKHGVESRASYYIRDAEDTGLDGDSFDVITEYGALHHMELDKAYAEMVRLLKPGGKVLCSETLGHNPLIHRYRKNTPHLRTEWETEHILRKPDIEKAGKYFRVVKVLGFYHLATLAAVPFRNTPVFNSVLDVLEAVDSLLLSLPVIKWQAWQVVFELSWPRKEDRCCGKTNF